MRLTYGIRTEGHTLIVHVIDTDEVFEVGGVEEWRTLCKVPVHSFLTGAPPEKTRLPVCGNCERMLKKLGNFYVYSNPKEVNVNV